MTQVTQDTRGRPKSPKTPKVTQVNPSRPKSTQVDPSQPKSTQVNPSDQSNPSRTGHTEPTCIEANYIICLSNHTAKESPRKSHYIYIPKER
ncbi:hypothetical protein DPMN_172742 [Dreissena polymorpha]|uniref:Uncharacterized protein n=1 Tax=Dreissena polymorpha TaxID=45954 RepID=A0A9D4IEW5_DREPO|nr:hypothetical protein DPMN_172742 [Dreissena polymorpha]